ncbi:hypothetical protein AX774_g3808 [Zancudomyces culisetae]|uniref:Uncharacterized protein n=1 Tax=Zancudomyces culisetae TaxID=1213189 RepID=A0A1R1PP17_ZANCU|nr:hypothetical protein AX774_g3808 [Zancudomyces culisetae]|eukprot:OMH82709.1 hypothetical protein AX774_g3808 [Zancudomyces culisetae]
MISEFYIVSSGVNDYPDHVRERGRNSKEGRKRTQREELEKKARDAEKRRDAYYNRVSEKCKRHNKYAEVVARAQKDSDGRASAYLLESSLNEQQNRVATRREKRLQEIVDKNRKSIQHARRVSFDNRID